jgi:hypothetical protein
MLSPHPWYLEEGRYIRDRQNRKIASCAYARHTISFKVTEDERRSNAQAMTAAPELLAFARKIANCSYSGARREIADLVDQARRLVQEIPS